MDHKDFGVETQILHELHVSKLRNNKFSQGPRVGITGYGLEIVECINY